MSKTKRHTRLQTLNARRKYIRKRLNFAKKVLFANRNIIFFEKWLEHNPPGSFSKYNFVCSCPLCRSRKYRESRQKDKFDYRQYQEET